MRPRRTHRLPMAFAVIVLAAGACGLLAACGNSALETAYTDYKVAVEPLLENERKLGKRIETMLQEGDDRLLPRYYALLADEALPFYKQLSAEIAALAPEREELAAAHEELLSFVDARIEFVHLQLGAREMNNQASGPGGVQDAYEALNAGEVERQRYREMVADDVPDARLSDLAQLDQAFQSRFFKPMLEGALDAIDVQRHLRNVLIPRVEVMLAKKFDDSPEDGQLHKWLQAQKRAYELTADVAPAWQQLVLADGEAAAAVEEAKDHYEEFVRRLAAVRSKI